MRLYIMLCSKFFYIAQRTICENKRIFHTFSILSRFDFQQCNLCVNSPYYQRNLNLIINKRFKSKKQAEHEDDSEDEDDSLEVDDYLNTKNSKIINTKLPSLRLDAVAKAAFGISRAKIEKAFYNSNLRVNGKKCYKKSAMVEVDDEIDLITGRSPHNSKFLMVHRTTLLSATGTSDGVAAKLLRNKSLLIEDYEDPWDGVVNN